ncbi:DNA-3-methyladenine glycosylase [Thermoleophilum album]|uniref:Putative 3-methyladenine DNA glycosylase n=1 Tax=Thermoleophilum album TaxID=29539 RepID=A0A1H6FX27_THEAL|nr:DNA-3-methyladenine glycosylase [Thermoleophilum album]SEH14830.1 DNA-3-methyladenine glycosylase [Thermoleophilum album]
MSTLSGWAAPSSGSSAIGPPLAESFYARDVLVVARELLGCLLQVGDTLGRIVETEAYHQREPACHGHNGRTPRCRSLFGPPGTAYVYRAYGIHRCFNVVCEDEGVGAAVLVRAVEPLAGIAAMRKRRGVERLEDLCSGPGKLCQAFAIELEHDGTSLVDGPIRLFALEGGRPRASAIVAAPRIGISRAVDLPWRFCLAESRFLSRPRPTPPQVAGTRD